VFRSSIWHIDSSSSNPPLSLTLSCVLLTRSGGVGRAVVSGGAKATMPRNWTRVRCSWATAAVDSGAAAAGGAAGGAAEEDGEVAGGWAGRAETGGRSVVEKPRRPVRGRASARRPVEPRTHQRQRERSTHERPSRHPQPTLPSPAPPSPPSRSHRRARPPPPPPAPSPARSSTHNAARAPTPRTPLRRPHS